MYNHHRTNHSRLLNREFLQKIILCFLIGFLCGAVFYYCFQNSFREILQATLENNTKTWTKETAFFGFGLCGIMESILPLCGF